jgi:hypothetical protein
VYLGNVETVVCDALNQPDEVVELWCLANDGEPLTFFSGTDFKSRFSLWTRVKPLTHCEMHHFATSCGIKLLQLLNATTFAKKDNIKQFLSKSACNVGTNKGESITLAHLPLPRKKKEGKKKASCKRHNGSHIVLF